MHYRMVGETGKIDLRLTMAPDQRKAECEREIKAILEKYGCSMVVNVIPK